METLQTKGVEAIASVSSLLRDAMAASLPVAPEQYLTIAIPGTVIDLADFEEGGSFVYDVAKHAMPPTTVRQSEGHLVDGMIPLSTIMVGKDGGFVIFTKCISIGNTGKSVARSYSRSLDGLVPAKADIGSSTGTAVPLPGKQKQWSTFTAKSKRYGGRLGLLGTKAGLMLNMKQRKSSPQDLALILSGGKSNSSTTGTYKRLKLEQDTLDEANGWIMSKETTISDELKKLTELSKIKLASSPTNVPVITGATAPRNEADKNTPHGLLLATEGAEKASPIFATPPAASFPATISVPSNPSLTNAEEADPWTTISFSYSASDVKQSAEQHSWGKGVGGAVGFGLWSVGGSYSHDETHESMQSDMAACDVSVSFSALVVNINRPWLYGELFSDIGLELADGVKSSPGPLALQKMIDGQATGDLAMYSQFPAYPTSFIVAADTTIEFTGSTKHIEQQFDSHSNSGGVSVGYGPWSVSSSFHEAASSQRMQVHSTATGCKLCFGAPQVVGWVSQILPSLPRPSGYNPMTQGVGLPLPA
ncbi:hypothetical protein GLAREA_01268 [Glarea lozoyensis ATCC 20868]|uniref:Uncharacterized protein n=1 Tax=Glarea lozoyensis (strain ATCC 20868 / MF5171) TaxID=1116229 RepID=S3CZW6_GLAL2|nr:uncharacterized protein GLAREA_01268 [Glarea lozoyensis ATCC 20868]EPE25356.1 hypothetical protein GLAREA_01268 [Glarea lozoyensis ATCC 20868]